MTNRQSALLIIVILIFPITELFGNIPAKKFKRIQKYLDKATHDNLTGVIVYIQSPKNGTWVGTSGYSNLEKKTLIQKDDILAMASIGKMYNAVAAMKLVEEGRIKLDDKIANYLPSEFVDNLPNGHEVTIRNLLGHTSGFASYEFDPELTQLYLSGQLRLDTLSHENVLRRYVFGKPSLSKPGTEFNYSSTNYMLLAMIMNSIIPEGHADYLRKLISQLGLTNTYYKQTPPQKNVRYYADLNQDYVLENLTDKTFETTNWFIGDDGVYAPIDEAAQFLQALMNGRILSNNTLVEMKTGNTVKVDTGLGLATDQSFPYGILYGHGGRAIAVTTDLYYFPRQGITIAIFCNNGLRGSTVDLKKSYNKMRTKIVKKLFLF
jgi:D-alanyl-D-alanine carboxypeptidase